jgi:hypothetical protein
LQRIRFALPRGEIAPGGFIPWTADASTSLGSSMPPDGR